jgi:uncharacterized protein (TIGR00106 family)
VNGEAGLFGGTFYNARAAGLKTDAIETIFFWRACLTEGAEIEDTLQPAPLSFGVEGAAAAGLQHQWEVKMSVIVDFAIFPTDKGAGVSRQVARAVRIIRESGLDCTTHAMGTQIEGDFDQVMKVVSRCFEEIRKDSDRIYMTLKADYRSGRTGGLAGKVASVEKKL